MNGVDAPRLNKERRIVDCFPGRVGDNKTERGVVGCKFSVEDFFTVVSCEYVKFWSISWDIAKICSSILVIESGRFSIIMYKSPFVRFISKL